MSTNVLAQGVVMSSGDVAANVGIDSLNGAGGDFGFSGGVNLTNHVAVLGEFNYESMGAYSYLGSSNSQNQSYTLYGGAVRYSFPISNKRFVPYALAGAGVTRQVAITGVTINRGVASYTTGSSMGGYISLGGGCAIYIKSNWGIRPEIRYDNLSYSVLGISSRLTSARESVSVFYQWGGNSSKKN
jgi:hypothetical protein